MGTLLQDIRFGFRLIRRQPGFSAIAVMVLALGIGANTAAFSLMNVLLLKPRAGGVDAELAGVYSRDRTRPDAYRDFSWEEFEALRERKDLFHSLSAHGFGLVGLTEGNATRRVFADIVTADFFETFGVAPVLGRAFSADEERPGADQRVVILSHGLWRRLGGTSDLIGQDVILNTRAYAVIGVAPEGFGGSMVLATPEIWVPTGVYDSMVFDSRNEGAAVSLGTPGFRALILVARLQAGATMASIAPGLDVVTRQMAAATPATHADYELVVAPLARLSVSTAPQTDSELTAFMSVLVGLAAVVLLIASFNLANMLLARGRSRSREFAIRMAIGGGRGRLIRQLLTENLVLALVGGAAGLAISSLAVKLIFVNLPALPISIAFDPTPDVRVLGATVAFSILAALVFGLGPAWRMSRTDVLSDLKDQPDAAFSGRRRFRWLTTRDTLVMGQLALTFVMLTAAGLFVRGALEAAGTDPGFTLDRGLMANVDTTLLDYSPEATRDFYRAAIAGMRAIPGVEAAAFASHMPFGEFESGRSFQRPGPPLRRGDPGADANLIQATTVRIGADYFDTMGLRVQRGRDFTRSEEIEGGGDPIAIIDETLARRLFGDADPVGQQVQTAGAEGEPPVVLRVVGVAQGVRGDLFDAGPRPFIYQPFGQEPRGNMYLHARTTAPAGAETAMLRAVRAALSQIVAAPPIIALETRPMFRERNLMLAVIRTGATIFGAFGAAALFLAAIGIYGVKSYLVSRRTREIGVRIALGAEPRDVVLMVLREGLVLVSLGLVAGLGLSVLTGRALRSVLFQNQPLDLVVVVAAAATLVASMVLASWLPARRATRVAPTTALRAS